MTKGKQFATATFAALAILASLSANANAIAFSRKHMNFS